MYLLKAGFIVLNASQGFYIWMKAAKMSQERFHGKSPSFNVLGLIVWSAAGSESRYEKIWLAGSVADPRFHFDADPNQTRLFTFMRIGIQQKIYFTPILS